MAYTELMSDVQSCLDLKTPDKLPIFFFSPTFDLKVSNISHHEYATSLEKIVRLHSNTVERFDYDMTYIHVDSCVPLEPIGIIGGPKGIDSPLPWTPCKFLQCNWKTLEGLKLPRPEKDGRMPIVLEAIHKLRMKFKDSLFICGHVTGPLTTVCYTVGTLHAMYLIYDDPALLQEFLDFSLALQMAFAKKQIEAGAHAVLISDLNSSTNFISLEHYEKFIFKITKKLVEAINNCGGIAIYFQNQINEEAIELTGQLINKGNGALGIGMGADIRNIKRKIGSKVCLMGNLNPLDLLIKSPLEIKSIVKYIIENVSKQGGHIICTGGQLDPNTPEINVRTVIQSVRENW